MVSIANFLFSKLAAVIGLLSLYAAACAPYPPGEGAGQYGADDPQIRDKAAQLTLPYGSSEKALAANRAACDDLQGSYSRQGMAGNYMCILSYSDAGKSCNSAQQCIGGCIVRQYQPGKAAQGVCKANSSPFGCYGTIDAQGRVTPILCRD